MNEFFVTQLSSCCPSVRHVRGTCTCACTLTCCTCCTRASPAWSGADRNSQKKKNDLLLACFGRDRTLSPAQHAYIFVCPHSACNGVRTAPGVQHCCECVRSERRNFRVSLRGTADFRPPVTPCRFSPSVTKMCFVGSLYRCTGTRQSSIIVKILNCEPRLFRSVNLLPDPLSRKTQREVAPITQPLQK